MLYIFFSIGFLNGSEGAGMGDGGIEGMLGTTGVDGVLGVLEDVLEDVDGVATGVSDGVVKDEDVDGGGGVALGVVEMVGHVGVFCSMGPCVEEVNLLVQDFSPLKMIELKYFAPR